MNPILFASTETKFDTNGLGVLSDAISCIVTEERNGSFELTMQYSVEGIHYADIADRSIILAKPSPTDNPQPFRVYRHTKPLNGIVTFYARHISYDLSGTPVGPFTATNVIDALNKLKTNAVVPCPFDFWTDKVTAASMNVRVPSDIFALLGGQQGSVLDVYGGEYKFDGYTVRLYNERGTDRGVSIRYGKNLLDLEQERNCANVCTGVYPYWVDSNGENLVQLPEKIVNAPGTYDFTRIKILDLSSEWQEAPSTEQLKARAETYIKENNIGVPTISLTVSHAMLENTEEYKGQALLERIDLCDTARIEFPKLGVSASAKAVKTEFNALLNRYESITFGDARYTLADNTVDQKKALEESTNKASGLVAEAMKRLNEIVQNSSGLYTTEEIQPDKSVIYYYHDKPNLTDSKNVIKFTADAIGLSTDGGKTYPFGFTVTGDMVANILSAIGVNANWINAGILQSMPDESGNRNFIFDLVTGEAVVNDLSIRGKDINEALSDAVTGVENQFYLSDSPTELSGGNWADTQPTWTQGKYIWSRQYVTFGDGTKKYLPSETGVCITGNTGAAGANGTNGTSAYTHIRYSANANGSGFVTEPNANTKYIGIYTGPSQQAPTSNTAYTWSKYMGDNGTNGTNGKDGNGIRSITYYYAATKDQTAPEAAKVTSETIPALSETNKYLWQKEVIDFTDASVGDKTTVILLAVYGDKGKDGTNGTNGTSVSITSTSIEYKADANGTTAPTSGWSKTIPPVSNGRYLWTKTVVSYSDGTSTTAYSVAYKGTNGTNGTNGKDGAPGEDGIGIESVEAQYILSPSDVSPEEDPSAHWGADIPEPVDGMYIWTRQKITYTDGSVEYAGQYCMSKTMGDIAQQKVDAQTQEDIFNKLTNNGELQGLFMRDGKLYINVQYLRGDTIDLNVLKLAGTICGLMQGNGIASGGQETTGIVIYGNGLNGDGKAEPPYIIVTSDGIRLQIGFNEYIYFSNGIANIVNENFTATGTIHSNQGYGIGPYGGHPAIEYDNEINQMTFGAGYYPGYAPRTFLRGFTVYVNEDDSGSTYLRGSDIYASKAIQSSSDRRLKKYIEPLGSAYESFLDNLAPVSFRYKREADNAPKHLGYVAQDVEAALMKAGHDKTDTALLGEYETEKGDRYMSIAYEEMIAALHLKVKNLETRIKKLEER